MYCLNWITSLVCVCVLVGEILQPLFLQLQFYTNRWRQMSQSITNSSDSFNNTDSFRLYEWVTELLIWTDSFRILSYSGMNQVSGFISESLNHSFELICSKHWFIKEWNGPVALWVNHWIIYLNGFVLITDSFRNVTGECLYEWVNWIVRNDTPLLRVARRHLTVAFAKLVCKQHLILCLKCIYSI